MIANFLINHSDKAPVSFHMPGHKGSSIYRQYGHEKFLNNTFECDITEIDGVVKLPNADWSKRRELRQITDNKEKVFLSDAVGRVCGVSVIPYPPGIPYLCPGETISKEDIEYISAMRKCGEKVIGVNEVGQIFVCL